MRNRFLALFAGFVLALLATVGRADTPAINRVEVFDDQFASAAAINTTAITCRDTSHPSTALRITIGLSGTNSTVGVKVAAASGTPATTYTLLLNGGTALGAGELYTFTLGVSSTYTYQIILTTGSTVAYCLVEEIQDGAL